MGCSAESVVALCMFCVVYTMVDACYVLRKQDMSRMQSLGFGMLMLLVHL